MGKRRASDGGSDDLEIVDREGGVIEVNLDRGQSGFVDRGSRYAYTYRHTTTLTGSNPCRGTISSTGEGRGAISDAGGIITLALIESTGEAFLHATGTAAGQTSVPDPYCGQPGPDERIFGASCPGTGAIDGIRGSISTEGDVVTIDCEEATTDPNGYVDEAFASGHLTLFDRSALAP